MKTLDLVVLLHEGPQARAYLTAMRRAGVRPRTIVHLVDERHPSTGEPMAGWLPGGVRTWWLASLGERSQNHWPRALRASHPALVSAIGQGLSAVLPDAEAMLAEMAGSIAWPLHCERYLRVRCQGFKDPRLVAALTALSPAPVLFTGGGIVPGVLLDIAGLRFIHIHPGWLPMVRGADGVLWSLLTRGRAGASAFYMARGIDVGAVIARREFPAMTFAVDAVARPDDALLYRALFSFFDPVLRAALLVRDVLPVGAALDALPADEQDHAEGITYHFLEPELRSAGLAALFPPATR